MPARTKKEGPIQLKALLEGDMAQKFLLIQKRYGLENRSDVIRLLVTRAYEEMFGKGARI